MRYVVIMAGGSGTRLWPLSRKGTPKQLLPLVEGKSLLRLAFERALHLVPAERIVVVTGASYLDAVRADVPEVADENLLGEPEGRDSLNACAWPAAVLVERDPDAVIAQLTADQIIEPVDAFAAAVNEGFAIAEDNADVLVTLGVVPTSPHTGYGYLERGDALEGYPNSCLLRSFAEKPDADTATAYLASGNYWWNAGMFVWRAQTLLDQMAQVEPAGHDDIRTLARHPERLADIFRGLRKISVDYAIMEPAARGETGARVVAVALPIQWRDVGGFASLADILVHDENDNAVDGTAIFVDAANNVVINRCPDRMVGVVGAGNMVIVQTENATLVAPLDDAEKVKQLVAALNEQAPQFA